MSETELLRVEQLNALDLFTGEAMDPLIAQIAALVDKHVPDVSTAKGRGEIASLARRVASSKVILDDLGKDLVSDWKEKAKKVDIVRKKMRDELDALRDRARLPLTNWEQVEADRLHQEEMDRQYDLAWDEAQAMHDLFERERIVREKESELARQEAERKAKEEADRREKERQEREARIAREAEERAKLAAEQAVQRERERAERAEREKEEAVRRAEQLARDEADRKERERLAAEQAERNRQEKLAANKRHQDKFDREAIDSADTHSLPNPEAWIAAIKLGKIEHVTINY